MTNQEAVNILREVPVLGADVELAVQKAITALIITDNLGEELKHNEELLEKGYYNLKMVLENIREVVLEFD